MEPSEVKFIRIYLEPGFYERVFSHVTKRSANFNYTIIRDGTIPLQCKILCKMKVYVQPGFHYAGQNNTDLDLNAAKFCNCVCVKTCEVKNNHKLISRRVLILEIHGFSGFQFFNFLG